MSGYTCKSCAGVWPENYCPTCGATIDRSLLAAPSEAPRSGVTERLEFTGSAGEYFRIWIVCVALTVLTLGLYAAWAKVKKRRYFWGNTLLAGRAFEYTGNPIALFKGNLIFGVAAIAYFMAGKVHLLLGLVALLGVLLIYPWLFYKAMRFNAYNTRHRNIRFGFHGEVGESYALNLGLALLMPLTLGFIWPRLQYRRKQYQLGNLSYGTSRFRFDGECGTFYAYFFKALGLVLLVALLAFVVLVAVLAVGRIVAREYPSNEGGVLYFAMTYVGAVAVMAIYYATRITNYVLGETKVPGVATLHASLRVSEVVRLELGNVLAIIGSLGLAIPWAAVRRARYRCSHLEVRFEGPIEAVTAASAPEPGALGEVAADQLDIDISF